MSYPEPSIVLGIPGTWKDRTDLVTSIAKLSGDYLFAGKLLMHCDSSESFELEVYEHDPTLAEKVKIGGMGQIPEEDFTALENHTYTLYLLSDETGREVAARMMDFAVALLDSGGLAVKIDTAGFAVSAAKWREHASLKAAYSLYRSFVTLVSSEEEFFTCGMKTFRLPDCCVEVGDLETAFEVATEFCCYMMDESPQMSDGHTFGLPEGGQPYRLSLDDYIYYPPDDLFHNPNGLWRLTPVN